jgi:N-acetylglucosaminyl-diphospho-decaprenol L-rhamnosyltransferase
VRSGAILRTGGGRILAFGRGGPLLRPGLAPDRRDSTSTDVVVVTYQSAGHVECCLEAARECPPVARLIVVDNASSDGSADAARRSGANVVIETQVNEGFARAVNRGLAETTSRRVLLLNPDALITPEALASLDEALTAAPDAVIAAPLLQSAEGALRAGAGRRATLVRRVGLCLPVVGRTAPFTAEYAVPDDPRARGRVVDAGYVHGAVMLVDRAFITGVGGLDERFFLFSEDEDLCMRAWRAGRRVLLDGRAVVTHAGGASCTDEVAREAQRLVSTHRLLEKHAGDCSAAAYHTGVLAAFALRWAAAAWDPRRRRVIALTALRFDHAVRTHAEPLERTPRDGTRPVRTS